MYRIFKYYISMNIDDDEDFHLYFKHFTFYHEVTDGKQPTDSNSNENKNKNEDKRG
jgi:hypothetical protein